MSSPDPSSLLARMPHGPPMRLVDEVVQANETHSVCLTRINQKRLELFGSGEALSAYIGIELIAQSAAMSLIFDSKEGDRMAGAIVQIRSFQATERTARLNDTLETRVEVELHFDRKIASVKGVVLLRGEVFCEGVITLALQIF